MKRLHRYNLCSWACLVLLGLLWITGCRSGFWSPDSSSLAVDVDGKLRVFNVANGTWTSLKTRAHYVLNPMYSPNGRMLAYYGSTQKDGSQGWNIWVRDLKTGKERPLFRRVLPYAPYNPMGLLTLKAWLTLSWSPDSRKLAYTRAETKWTSIEFMDVATGRVKTLGKRGQEQRYPVWSPDGKKIAYMAETNPHVGGHYISPLDPCVVDVNGKNRRRLWNSNKQAMGWPFAPPLWSSDGSGLIMLTVRSEERKSRRMWGIAGPYHVRFIPINGSANRIITTVATAMATMASDLKSVVYVGGSEKMSLILRRQPFNTAHLLDTWPTEAFPAMNKALLGEKRSSYIGFSMYPYPEISPDGKTIALLPLINPATKRWEMRLYNVATDKRRIHAIP